MYIHTYFYKIMYTYIYILCIYINIAYNHLYNFKHICHMTIYRWVYIYNTNQWPAPPLPFNFPSLWPNWYNVEASRMPRGPMRAPERYWVPISLGTPKTAKSKLSVSCVQSVKGGYLKIPNPNTASGAKKPRWVEYRDENHLKGNTSDITP